MFKSMSTSLILRGALAVVVGVIAIAWPGLTVLALVILLAAHHLVVPYLDPILDLTVGLPHLYFLPVWDLALLTIAGTLLGGLGGYLGRGR